MREILFRGKRVDNGEWIEGGYAENGGKTFIIVRTRYIPDTRDWDTVEYYENNPCYHLSMIEVDPETVCQYTGLTDKNGRRIFEGDIFYDQNRNSFSVGFINCSFIAIPIKEITKKIIGRKWLTEFAGLSGYIEVIGNIFDNPELTGE